MEQYDPLLSRQVGNKMICVICPVRNGVPNEVVEYVARLEDHGIEVHFPPRDNPQDDPTGYYICDTMRAAIVRADEVHVFYSPDSQGCHFDLGMCFALGKKVKILNHEIDTTPNKSYVKVFLYANSKSIS